MSRRPRKSAYNEFSFQPGAFSIRRANPGFPINQVICFFQSGNIYSPNILGKHILFIV